MSGCKKNSKLPEEKKPLSDGWIAVPSKGYPNRVYFYNMVTKCSTWTNPCENTNNIEHSESSSGTSSSGRSRLYRTKQKKFEKSHSKRQKSKNILDDKIKFSNNQVNNGTGGSTFKRRDKTPAQTVLLKLRKQNAEKLKKLVTKHPEIFGNSSSVITKVKNSGTFDLEKQTENDNFNDDYSKISLHKSTESLNKVGLETSHLNLGYSEEMDWEPSNEKSDARNINEFHQQFDRPNAASSEVFGTLNSSGLSISPLHTWFLVLDTNIFVSCLGFVKELRDTKVPELGYPVIYVHWRVLQELDHLKGTKIDTVDRNLHINVRKAIAYLNENFKSRHPRVIGQSFEEFSKLVEVETFGPDDEILQTCIQFQKQQVEKKLMLLTNDKNLESKALVSGIEVYSKERFRKKYLNSNLKSKTCTNALNMTNNVKARVADYCLCEAKTVLKDFLTVVVEAEMKDAFEEDWMKIAVKKPPWTLQDVMDCVMKHWRSVFFIHFCKNTYSEVELLYEELVKKKSDVNTKKVEDIIKATQRLITSIKNSQKKIRPYLDLIPDIMTKLSNLLNFLSANYMPEADGSLSTSLIPTASSVDGSYFNTQQISENEVSKIKTLFKGIWDSLMSFCCSVSDVVNSPNVSNETIQEIRLKLSQILNEVGELIVIVEKILEIKPADIAEIHPLIIHFSNFLIKLNPNMLPETKIELPKCLVGFFTDLEGRSLLNNSLKGFREFFQDLMKANDCLNTRFAC